VGLYGSHGSWFREHKLVSEVVEGSRRPFVVLDRDGTIIVERHYLSDPDEVELIPGAGHSLFALSRLGLGLLVATNQSGVGRGYFSQMTLAQVHDRLSRLLEVEGVVITTKEAPQKMVHLLMVHQQMLVQAQDILLVVAVVFKVMVLMETGVVLGEKVL